MDPDAPLSIIIGVTGHRDLRLEDIPALQETLRSQFLDIQRRYPHSSLVLLSPLAEGADRLTARVALQLGIRLIVPLPMCRELYEQDFEAPGSRAEFSDLLERAGGVIHLPLLPGTSEEDLRLPGWQRDREYAKVGAFIASRSQIFFALWDGVSDPPDGEKTGGTAQIVRFRLRGVPVPYTPAKSPLTLGTTAGPVYHVLTPRQSSSAVDGRACTTHTLLPENWTIEPSHQICRHMDGFNRDAHGLRQPERTSDKSKAQLLNIDAASVPDALVSLPAPCRRILGHYAAADALALQFGSRTLATSRRVSYGVAAAALFFNMHSSFFAVQSGVSASAVQTLAAMPWYLICFLVLSTFTAIYIYGRAEKAEYQNKYQDYRALAEALRIQFYWTIAGLPEPVVEFYLRKQRSELEWLRSALRSWDVLTAVDSSAAPADVVQEPQRLELLTHWIHDQRSYFALKTKQEKHKLQQETTMIRWLLKLSGGLSVALALALSIPLVNGFAPSGFLQRLVPGSSQHAALMVVIPMLAVSAGLLHSYGQQLARSEHVRQFSRMAELFYAGERELDALLGADRQSATTNLVRELGLEALEENGDWLILHRERPLEVPSS